MIEHPIPLLEEIKDGSPRGAARSSKDDKQIEKKEEEDSEILLHVASETRGGELGI